jgi:hypothetical protein
LEFLLDNISKVPFRDMQRALFLKTVNLQDHRIAIADQDI